MKMNKTAIEAQIQTKDEFYMGLIQVYGDHHKSGIRKGIIKCVTADDLMDTFEGMLDAGLVHGRDFTMYFHRRVLDILNAYDRITDILDTYQRRVDAYVG